MEGKNIYFTSLQSLSIHLAALQYITKPVKKIQESPLWATPQRGFYMNEPDVRTTEIHPRRLIQTLFPLNLTQL